MRYLVPCLTVTAVLLVTVSSLSAQVSRAEIEEAIDRGVKYLIDSQDPDGHWAYKPRGGAESEGYKVGHTALAVLALQHSGTKRAEAQLAIKKGLSYILQQPPESKTYSSGLVLQALYADSATEHVKMVTAYAWMLCGGQKRDGVQEGSWTYSLPNVPANWAANGFGGGLPTPSGGRSDNSNSQFGILGLVYAQKAGFQVPRIIWERAKKYYEGSQHDDGGWDYLSDAYRASLPVGAPEAAARRPTIPMTLAGTVSIYLCDEMLADKRHRQCEVPPANAAHEAGLKWIAEHWATNQGPYGWYACERLGILIGYSEFGGHDWYQEGARDVMGDIGGGNDWHGPVVNTSFAVLFLARGRHPIIINKLKREGDWNLHRYDLKNLIEHISGPWQTPCQWRIVTLDAPVDFLLKVPILWISGHEALKLTPEQKEKLKQYVERGGTILGEACCSKKAFDQSFRELVKELWPDNDLNPLPNRHAIFEDFRKLESRPTLLGMALDKGQGRLGVIYIPNGISCRWEVGGTGARQPLDVGACIYLYVDKVNKRVKAEASARGAEPAVADKPSTPARQGADTFGDTER